MHFKEYITEGKITKAKFSSHEKKILKTIDKLFEQLNDYKSDVVAFSNQEGLNTSLAKNNYVDDIIYVTKEYTKKTANRQIGNLMNDIKNKTLPKK